MGFNGCLRQCAYLFRPNPTTLNPATTALIQLLSRQTPVEQVRLTAVDFGRWVESLDIGASHYLSAFP
jgi:hypothetical protein